MDFYAHLFENRHIGLPRAVFWAISVPVVQSSSNETCNLTVEWLPLTIRNWRDITKLRLNIPQETHGIEFSIYHDHEHKTGQNLQLQVFPGQDNEFQISAAITMEDHSIWIADHVKVCFEGVLVVPDNLFPKPSTPEEVLSAAGEFLDLNYFEAPELLDGNFLRYILRPSL